MKGTNVFPVDLQTKRKELKMTQEDFAELLGVSKSQVQKIEAGYRNLTMAKACEVASLLGGLTVRYKGVDFELKQVKVEPAERETNDPKLEENFIRRADRLIDCAKAILVGAEDERQSVLGVSVLLSALLAKMAFECISGLSGGATNGYSGLSGDEVS